MKTFSFDTLKCWIFHRKYLLTKLLQIIILKYIYAIKTDMLCIYLLLLKCLHSCLKTEVLERFEDAAVSQ